MKFVIKMIVLLMMQIQIFGIVLPTLSLWVNPLQGFCSACKVTLFEEHLIHKLLKIDESFRLKSNENQNMLLFI